VKQEKLKLTSSTAMEERQNCRQQSAPYKKKTEKGDDLFEEGGKKTMDRSQGGQTETHVNSTGNGEGARDPMAQLVFALSIKVK